MPPGKSPFAGLFKNALIRTSCISKLKACVYKTFSKTSKTSNQSESKLRKLIRSFLAKDFSLKFNPPPACVSYKKEFHVSHELIFSHLAVLFFPTPLSNNNMSSRHIYRQVWIKKDTFSRPKMLLIAIFCMLSEGTLFPLSSIFSAFLLSWSKFGGIFKKP